MTTQMPGSVAVWRHRQEDEWMPYDPETNNRIEEAFSAFWRSGIGSTPVMWWKVLASDSSMHHFIDFRTLEQSTVMADGTILRCIVSRQDITVQAPREQEKLHVEWGFAQDVGFETYDVSITSLLEVGYLLYKAGVTLKGTMFTAKNSCDYLADFANMQQVSILTRSVRHIFRHNISEGMRMGIANPDNLRVLAANAVGQLLGDLNDASAECRSLHTPLPQLIAAKTQLSAKPASRGNYRPTLSTTCSDIGSISEICSDSEIDSETKMLQMEIKRNFSKTSLGTKTKQEPSPCQPSGSLPVVDASSTMTPVQKPAAVDNVLFNCLAGVASICNCRAGSCKS
jgi:hypothetical protein